MPPSTRRPTVPWRAAPLLALALALAACPAARAPVGEQAAARPLAVATIGGEAEALPVASKSSDAHRTFDDPSCSGGRCAILDANAAGDQVTYLVSVPEARAYSVRVRVKRFPTRGRVQLSIAPEGGSFTAHGPVQDLYAAGAQHAELAIADVAFGSAGRKWFRFTVTGRNPASSGHTVSVDSISLVPPGTAPFWTASANAPLGLFEAQAAAVNGRLLVFGGFHNTSIQATVRSSAFDPAANAWSRLADMPVPTTHAGQAVDGNVVWIAGGFLGDHPGPATNRVWKYDATKNSWSAGPSLPAARAGGALVRLGRTLHYFGGTTRDGDRYLQDHADHWTLALDGGTAWSARAPLPNPRNHLGGAAAAGRVYAVGGQHLGDETGGNQASVHAYDPGTNKWSAVASLPRPLGHVTGSTFARDDRIMVAGGVTNGGNKVASVLSYDPVANAWTELPALPAPRQSPAADSVSGRLVVSGGRDVSGNPTTGTWVASP